MSSDYPITNLLERMPCPNPNCGATCEGEEDAGTLNITMTGELRCDSCGEKYNADVVGRHAINLKELAAVADQLHTLMLQWPALPSGFHDIDPPEEDDE